MEVTLMVWFGHPSPDAAPIIRRAVAETSVLVCVPRILPARHTLHCAADVLAEVRAWQSLLPRAA